MGRKAAVAGVVLMAALEAAPVVAEGLSLCIAKQKGGPAAAFSVFMEGVPQAAATARFAMTVTRFARYSAEP